MGRPEVWHWGIERGKIMTKEEAGKIIQGEAYDFLRTDKCLGNNICLLTLGGSHAYGMNVEGSDVDIRGFATRSRKDILLGKDFEQVVEKETDTTIYSFIKGVHLLCAQNPNMLEILFVKPEHVIYKNQAGQILLDNRRQFLTRKIFYTCGGYASEQLRRLDNKTMASLSQERQEAHILNSIKNAKNTFPEAFSKFGLDDIRLYLDDATEGSGLIEEIFMDVSLTHYPLRDYAGMWNAMRSIVKDYNKVGKRAKNAYAKGKVNKHAAHLVRLLLLAERALREGEFCTFMEDDHDLLMSIRNGDYMGSDGQMVPEFFAMVEELNKKMKTSFENTCLPKEVDMDKVDDIIYTVNDLVVTGSLRAPQAPFDKTGRG